MRIENEVAKIPNAFFWATAAKEIENYVPGAVLGEIFGNPTAVDPGQFERFLPSESKEKVGSSYLEKSLTRKSFDKVDMAIEAVPRMTIENMRVRFDWESAMRHLVEHIARWNE